MTVEETMKILTILSAFYGEGKSDTRIMVAAWHEMLEPYEYYIVRRAVMNYAREDTREYASFPTPGRMIKTIESELAVYNEIFNSMLSQNTYDELSDKAKSIISKDRYNAVAIKGYLYKINNREEIIKQIKATDQLLITEQKRLKGE